MVVSKPQGMAVHPAPGSRSDTLVQSLREWYRERGFPNRHVAAVSRLDKGTSGLVLIATDPVAHPGLHKQVLRREVKRVYQCLVWGEPLFDETTVEAPLGRHWEDPRRMAVYDLPVRMAARWGARPAVTHLRVVDRFPGMALLAATLETGRMHQIRVHCQFLRLPVVGDPVYGPAGTGESGGHWSGEVSHEAAVGEITRGLEWQCLHAGRLAFRHPLTGNALEFYVPAPAPFSSLLEALGAPQGKRTM